MRERSYLVLQDIGPPFNSRFVFSQPLDGVDLPHFYDWEENVEIDAKDFFSYCDDPASPPFT